MSLISSRLIGSSLLFWCFSAFLSAQEAPSPPDKCLLEGKVLNSVTGEPVRKAQVTLIGMAASGTRVSQGGSTITDTAGRFEFSPLEPGSYRVSAFRQGYDSPSGRGYSKSPLVTLASGEEKRGMVIRLTPLGVVTGRVLDEDGDPIRQIQVQAMAYRYTASGRQLAGRFEAVTNDLGEYRIFDVIPGRYYLRASSPGVASGGHGEAYGASYYPGTPDSTAAATIEIGGGQTLEGIDLTLRPTRFAKVRGRVMNPGKNLTVSLLKVTGDGGPVRVDMGVRDPDGKFVLRDISPGSYLLTAESNVTGQQWTAAQLPIQVGAADLEGFELHLQPPMEIAGQIRIEGKSRDKLSALNIVLESGHRTRMAGGTGEDGSFVFQGLEPAVYQVSVQGPPDLYLKSVRWSDRDVTQSGVDLTQGAAESRLIVLMSANGGQLDGVVEDDQSAPVFDAAVTLVPCGTLPKSLLKAATTDSAGHFHMSGIAPGSYRLFAWEEVDRNQLLYDPDFLKPYDSQGESVEISEGSRQSVQLTLIKQAPERQPSQ